LKPAAQPCIYGDGPGSAVRAQSRVFRWASDIHSFMLPGCDRIAAAGREITVKG
jgi:hypothetical protein